MTVEKAKRIFKKTIHEYPRRINEDLLMLSFEMDNSIDGELIIKKGNNNERIIVISEDTEDILVNKVAEAYCDGLYIFGA